MFTFLLTTSLTFGQPKQPKALSWDDAVVDICHNTKRRKDLENIAETLAEAHVELWKVIASILNILPVAVHTINGQIESCM